MIKNYFLIAFRNILRDKLHASINLLGFSLALTCFAITFLVLKFHSSFDEHYEDAERIHRISLSLQSTTSGEQVELAWADAGLVTTLRDSYTDAEAVSALKRPEQNVSVSIGNTHFTEENFIRADSQYFRVFSHQFIEGNPKKALAHSNSIVISKELSEKYFGKQASIINSSILVNGESYIITGVIENLPEQTDLRFDAILSGISLQDWCFIYVKLKEGIETREFASSLDIIFNENLKDVLLTSNYTGFYLSEKLTDLHLSKRRLFDSPKGSKELLFILAAIGVIIIIIAGMNYITLSFTKALARDREVAIRRAHGATKRQVFVQFVIESLALAAISSVVVALLISCFLNFFGSLLQMEFSLNTILQLTCAMTALIFVISTVTGFYSSKSQTGSIPTRNGSNLWRKFILSFQFAVVIGIILSTIVVSRQVTLLKGELTSSKISKVMVLTAPTDKSTTEDLVKFKNDLDALAFVTGTSVITSNSLPAKQLNVDMFAVRNEGGESIKAINYIRADHNYFKVLNIDFLQGKTFSYGSEDGDADIIVNKAFVDQLNWKDPLNEKVSLGDFSGESLRIIGVVDNFPFHGIASKAEPIIFRPLDGKSEKILLRLEEVFPENLAVIQKIWQRSFKSPQQIHMEFLDSLFLLQIQNQVKLQELLRIFTVLSLIISSVGLFGLVSLNLQQKTKETGVRIILGAGVASIYLTYMKTYLILICVSAIIGVTVTQYFLDQWLSNFPIKQEIGFYEFAIAIASAFLLLFASTSNIFFKTVNSKPTDLIRSV